MMNDSPGLAMLGTQSDNFLTCPTCSMLANDHCSTTINIWVIAIQILACYPSDFHYNSEHLRNSN